MASITERYTGLLIEAIDAWLDAHEAGDVDALVEIEVLAAEWGELAGAIEGAACAARE